MINTSLSVITVKTWSKYMWRRTKQKISFYRITVAELIDIWFSFVDTLFTCLEFRT